MEFFLKISLQSTVASKFLTLTESVRNAADLYLSLNHPPVVFINDTPCGFVRHMECRDPDTAKQLWGSTSGCFEKPTLGKDPDWVLALVVPIEELFSFKCYYGPKIHFSAEFL